MPKITFLGNGGVFWILLSLVLLCFSKRRKTGIAMAVSLLFCLICGNLVLKPLVARLRPCDLNRAVELLIARPADYSFPSGHTFASFASITVLFLMERKAFWIPALVLGTLITFSRLYLYVHYPTDILGGIILGVSLGLLAVFLIRRFFPGSAGKGNDYDKTN